MSARLEEKLLARIAESGPITFAEFMEAALYDPDDGFFAAHPVGRQGHFVTSPHVSQVFGILIARALFEYWGQLGAPSTFDVIELGAGDGTLARQVLRSVTGPFAEALRYRAVERSERARSSMTRAGIEAFGTVQEAAPRPITGVMIANELLDNVPFHRVEGEHEMLVGESNGALSYVRAPLRDEVRASMSSIPVEGEIHPAQGDASVQRPAGGATVQRPAMPAARAYVRATRPHLARGCAIFIDYGFTAGEPVEPIRGYRDQRLVHDLLTDPGSCDITGPVDFDAICDEARAAGFDVHGPVAQRDALLAFGYQPVLDEIKAQQQTADARRAVELFNARNEAAMLIDPNGLGALKVVAFTTPGAPAPRLLL